MRIIRACKLSEPILHYFLINDRELCPGQPCELSGMCELARVKLSGLYVTDRGPSAPAHGLLDSG